MKSDHSCIFILLATYNGEHYLPKLLASLAEQTTSNWQLWIRDDGSTDKTRSLIETAAQQDPRIHLLQDRHGNLGAKANFALLTQAALGAGAPYFAFCDQDDVWHPEKLEQLRACVQETEAQKGLDTPLLACCDLEIVDATLTPLAPSHYALAGVAPWTRSDVTWLFFHNVIPGCAMLGNRALLKTATPQPETAVMHDWWYALVAATCGEVLWLPTPLVRYRQHSTNTIGAHSPWQHLRSLLHKPIQRTTAWQKQFLSSLRQTQTLAIHQPVPPALLAKLHLYLQSPFQPTLFQRQKMLKHSTVQALSPARNLLMHCLIAKGLPEQFKIQQPFGVRSSK